MKGDRGIFPPGGLRRSRREQNLSPAGCRQASVFEIAERFKDTVSVSTDQVAQVTNIMMDYEFKKDPKKKKEDNPVGPMGITPATAELIAEDPENKKLGWTEKKILTDQETNIQAGMWQLFKDIMPKFKDTKNPLLFALAAYSSSIKTVENAQKNAALNSKTIGVEDHFAKVIKYLPEKVKVFVRKFYPVLTERN